MKRPRRKRWLKRIAIGIVAIPVAMIALILMLANLDPGRRLIEHMIAWATGDTVRVSGLAGRFPDQLRIAHVSLRDPAGSWLDIDGVALDWAPSALLLRRAHIERLTVDTVAVARLPITAPSQPQPASQASPLSLPVRVQLDTLQIHSLAMEPPVVGAKLALRVEGHADLVSLETGQADIALHSLRDSGAYRLHAVMDAGALQAMLDAQEPSQGVIAALAKLPDLGGPIALHATLNGPRNAEATHLALAAGSLTAHIDGTLDLAGQAAALAITAQAPAMAPRADLSWQSIDVKADVHGPFTHPDAMGTVRLAGLLAGGAAMRELSLDFTGNAGRAQAEATLTGLRIPGPKPDLLEASPLVLKADAVLDAPDRPIVFSARHPLLQADGKAKTGQEIQGDINLDLPELQPFAAVAGVDLQGGAKVVAHMATHGLATQFDVDGTVGITGGMAPVPALIGPNARLGATAILQGNDITVRRAEVEGRTLHVDASGADKGGALDLDWHVALSDLSALATAMNGALQVQGHLGGAQNDLAVTAALNGAVGTAGLPRGPIHAELQAKGLPAKPDATLDATGTLAGSDLRLTTSVQRSEDGALHVALPHLAWKGMQGHGDFSLASGSVMPTGHARLDLQLADLRPLLGQPIAGHVQAILDSASPDKMTLQLRAAQVQVAGLEASADLDVNGPPKALAIRLDATAHPVMGADARVQATGTLDAPGQTVSLQSVAANWHGEALRLPAPVRIDFGQTMALTPLRASLGDATIEVAGQIKPGLNLTASARNVTPALAKPFAPDLQADGTISADAKLSGSLTAPMGTIHLAAQGLHLRTGPARSLPPANIQAQATLHGSTTTLDTRIDAGSKTRLHLAGTAPLAKTGPIELHADGAMDLDLLDPILMAQGRRVRGAVSLHLAATGTVAQPRVVGSVRLTQGEIQDFTQGVHITDLIADLEAEGSQIRIAGLSGHAGPGTIEAHGAIGVLQPEWPVDIKLTARNAQPLAADRLTANIDADLAVHGAIHGQLAAGGQVTVKRATVNIPDRLPVSVAVLNVRQAGAPSAPPGAATASAGPDIVLDLRVDAPADSIFVRGHGLDSVLGGSLQVSGHAGAPEISGGFKMEHGTFSLAGTTLNFTHGRVSFSGANATGKIDPTLDFEADSIGAGTTAKLLVGGYASAPKITLASDPPLPQDEVLAHLLFGTGTQSLGPFQIASIAEALASITGIGGSTASNPLGAIRNGLGLDRLSVGADSGNSIANSIPDLNRKRAESSATDTTTVQAGRYIANGVYVGAKQGTSGADTQAEIQIDITKRLKAETDLGSGRDGSNVGITYQFQY